MRNVHQLRVILETPRGLPSFQESSRKRSNVFRQPSFRRTKSEVLYREGYWRCVNVLFFKSILRRKNFVVDTPVDDHFLHGSGNRKSIRENRSIAVPTNCLTYWSRLFQIFRKFPVRKDEELMTALFSLVAENTCSVHRTCPSKIDFLLNFQNMSHLFNASFNLKSFELGKIRSPDDRKFCVSG
jgi:hypothetical protein